ncbi:MlaD family protein, partial [Mycolicibacterium elephantis]
MIRTRSVRRIIATLCCGMIAVTGCSFEGVNSLPLPGTVGRGPDAAVYHVQLANVGSLESNSPVLIDDVVVGSIGKMRVRNWRADLEVSVRPDVVVPANA